MDYNDISARLKRVLSSLNERFDDEIAVYTTVTKDEKKVDEKTTEFNFKVEYHIGKHDQETLINRIAIILYNIASLKDHTKNHIKNIGGSPQIVEDEINNSLHLQVLIDIVNQEKHGYPLRSRRSLKDPLIKKITESYQVTTSGSNQGKGSSLIFMTQQGFKHVGDGKEQMVIVADITDGNGNFLFSLDELVETSFSQMEKLILNNLKITD